MRIGDRVAMVRSGGHVLTGRVAGFLDMESRHIGIDTLRPTFQHGEFLNVDWDDPAVTLVVYAGNVDIIQ